MDVYAHTRSLCVRTLCFLFLMFASVCETEKCFSGCSLNEGFRIFPRAKVSAFGMGLCINSVVPLGSRAIFENGYAILKCPAMIPTTATLEATAYEKGNGKRCCRCRSLPGTGRSCERRDTPLGRCRSGSSLVAARRFNIVPAACLPVICEVVQADTGPKTNVGSNSGKGET